MEKKMNLDQFKAIMVEVENGNEVFSNWAVRCIISGELYSERFAEIPEEYKQSLCRKAFRSVAFRSSYGTLEATGVATSCGFHQMKNGNPVMIDGFDPREFSFTFTCKYANDPEKIGRVECHREGKRVWFCKGNHFWEERIDSSLSGMEAVLDIVQKFEEQ